MSKNKKSGPVQNNPYGGIIKLSVLLGFFIFCSYYFFSFSFLYLIGIYIFPVLLYFVGNFLYTHKIIPQKIYIIQNIIAIIFSYFASLSFIFHLLFEVLEKNILVSQQILFHICILLLAGFHIFIHLKHGNIISLLMGAITGIFSLYSIFVMILPGII